MCRCSPLRKLRGVPKEIMEKFYHKIAKFSRDGFEIYYIDVFLKDLKGKK